MMKTQSQNKRRNKSIIIRLSEEEKTKIMEHAKKHSNTSDYIRFLIKKDLEKEHWFWDIEALEYLQKKGIIEKSFVNGVKNNANRQP